MLPFELSRRDIKTVRAIVCKHDRLTIGAPSSPILSNAVLFDFDDFWFKKTRRRQIVYTRYADDLYFSTNRQKVLENVYSDLREHLKKMKSPRLSINEDKTVFTSRKHKRLVTGLVLTSDKKISIGREKKRHIRGMVYRFKEGQLDEQEVAYLRGFLAYVKAVEPRFLTRLRRKYGRATISAILKAEIVSRKE
jgi:retron-type reverse transcriptase